jgi:predicted short-subunit dehydrogenase-like oxidoreductase (DUF2520 family)
MPSLKRTERSGTGKPLAKKPARKLSVAIVGAGRLASALAPALDRAGFRITEIISRDLAPSRRKAGVLAATLEVQATTANSAPLAATLLWLCVPDREIRRTASALAGRISASKNKVRFAFHSSGALLSRELDSLRDAGVAVASVHPLMTFVADSEPPLAGVPFAIEGDAAAVRVARQAVRALGGESFVLPAGRKAAYHAWATMTSPLLLALLVTMEQAARAAGLTRDESRRKSLPIIRQTLANYQRLGPAKSFSGPLIRGDVSTVAKHLEALTKHSEARAVYLALAGAATRGLPVKNKKQLQQLLQRHR